MPVDSLSPVAPSPPAFRLEGTGFAYGRHAVLAPFAFDLGTTETVAILGTSGCGKSTLLRLLAGVLVPTRGTVTLLAGDPASVGLVDGNGAEARFLGIGALTQKDRVDLDAVLATFRRHGFERAAVVGQVTAMGAGSPRLVVG